MSNLYFLAPSQQIARQVIGELHELGFDDERIGLIAREGIDLEDLPEAGVSDKSDAMPSIRRGLAAGGATGLLAGLVVNVIPGGLALGGLALAAATIAGGAFGAWVSSLVGISLPNSEVETYRSAIDQGQILMIVHAAKPEEADVRQAVMKHHPEVVFGGTEHVLPPLG